MSSSTPEPPPGTHPGGQAGDSSAGPQFLSSPLNSSHVREDKGGAGGVERSWLADPRPPVPGGEDAPGPDPQPPYGDWGKESPVAILPYPSHHLYAHFQGEGVEGPAAVPGSAEAGSPICGGGEGSSTPPVVRWSQSLQHLLEDPQGVQLFQEYLREECGTCEAVLFWFACNGLRLQDPWQLVPIIWKKFIRNYAVRVTEKTYKTINDRINARSIDRNIFDDAQREVGEEIERSTYPSFLKSETYLTYLGMVTQQGGGPGAESPHSPSPSSPGGVSTGVMLPTLHEDCEYESATQLRLTQETLAATVKRRAAPERRKPEAYAGQYLHGGRGVNPYHAVYGTVHLSSRQDSELQSLSSDALTDDTLSCTDSSVDGMSIGHPVNPKYLKKQYRIMRENARQNQNLERCLSGGNGHSGIGGGGMLHGAFLPRTHRICHESIPNLKPQEFASLLIEKLEKVQRERESQEKVQQSFKRIQEGDNVSDECRREHAFNSLPPLLLLDKLAQKISIDDVDPCQSILDEHVSRVWQDSNNDTPARSPGSPRPRSPTTGRRSCSTQSARPTSAQLASKLVHLQQGHSIHHLHGHLAHLQQGHLPHLPMGHQVHLPPGHMLHPYQATKNWGHARRRDRDVYSTFSSDSGNVADYYEGSDRPGAPHLIPKSRSMPDYMENYAGTSSDGGSSGCRKVVGGRRSSSRRPPADLTDSGVSVVSDSGPSSTPSASSTERRSGSSGGRRSGSGMSVGGIATNGSNNSGSGSVVGGGRTGSQERGAWVGVDTGMHLTHGHSFHLPQGSLQPHLPHQDDSKRRSRGGGSHGSGRSGGHSSSHSSGHSRGQSETGSGRTVAHGDTLSTAATSANSGSNGSTLRRARPPRHTQSTPTGMACESGGGSGAGSGSNQLGPGAGASSNGSFPTTNAPEVTTIVYNFHDDAVPFVTRVPTFPVTLKRFKQHLPKKGNYRFFFKKHCEEFGLINEEITEDSVNLPLFEGKIFAQIRKAD